MISPIRSSDPSNGATPTNSPVKVLAHSLIEISRYTCSPFPQSLSQDDRLQSHPSRIQPRSIDRPCRHELLLHDLFFRVLSRSADIPLNRPRQLETHRPCAQPSIPTGYADGGTRRWGLCSILAVLEGSLLHVDVCFVPQKQGEFLVTSARINTERLTLQVPPMSHPRGFYVSTDNIWDESTWSDPIYFDMAGIDQDVSRCQTGKH